MQSRRRLGRWWCHFVLSWLVLNGACNAFSSTAAGAATSIVTGASGYLGRAIVNELLQSQSGDGNSKIICLVRDSKVDKERIFWSARIDGLEESDRLHVMAYDMLDGGTSVQAALHHVTQRPGHCVIYHVASYFGPSDSHKQQALANVQGTRDVVECLARTFGNSLSCSCKLVLTSSMAAVRGSGQAPVNGEYYTAQDWNTQSELGASWGASYQWSKKESERVATDLCQQYKIDLVSLCPSFIFGPPVGSGDARSSFSVDLVRQWVTGEAPVQSRLYCDIRDVALAHVLAGRQNVQGRLIVSTERRIPSQTIAVWLQAVCRETGLSDVSKVHYDADFDGGAIPIGELEVAAAESLKNVLGLELRRVEDTIVDMAQILLHSATLR